MKHLSRIWYKLTAVVTITAALSSCNRAEYAMLPKTTSYHGTERIAPQPATVAETTAKPAAETPVVTPAPTVAAAPAVTTPVEPKVGAPATKAAIQPSATPRKPSFLQSAMLKKVTKKAEKMADKMVVRKNQETAGTSETNAITGNLRTGIILLLVGLLITIIPGDIFSLIGGIVAIIGIIFIVLWLLDNL